MLVSEAGEEVLQPGDAAGFKAGTADGHCLQNRSAADATVLEVGTRPPQDGIGYPGLDMILRLDRTSPGCFHRDGTPDWR